MIDKPNICCDYTGYIVLHSNIYCQRNDKGGRVLSVLVLQCPKCGEKIHATGYADLTSERELEVDQVFAVWDAEKIIKGGVY